MTAMPSRLFLVLVVVLLDVLFLDNASNYRFTNFLFLDDEYEEENEIIVIFLIVLIPRPIYKADFENEDCIQGR